MDENGVPFRGLRLVSYFEWIAAEPDLLVAIEAEIEGAFWGCLEEIELALLLIDFGNEGARPIVMSFIADGGLVLLECLT